MYKGRSILCVLGSPLAFYSVLRLRFTKLGFNLLLLMLVHF